MQLCKRDTVEASLATASTHSRHTPSSYHGLGRWPLAWMLPLSTTAGSLLAYHYSLITYLLPCVSPPTQERVAAGGGDVRRNPALAFVWGVLQVSLQGALRVDCRPCTAFLVAVTVIVTGPRRARLESQEGHKDGTWS